LSPIEPVRMRTLFYERRIQSFDKLMQEIRHLDSDSGVRVVGSYLNKDCFAFLTRSVGTYTVMVYQRSGHRMPAVGARILSRDFASVDELRRFLKQIMKEEVDAYVY
jgi:hypothetical protein